MGLMGLFEIGIIIPKTKKPLVVVQSSGITSSIVPLIFATIILLAISQSGNT
jgi:hypothetical protein